MIAGHLREKDGHYYCVLSYVDYTGERKQIWKATGLPVKGNKKRAEEMLSHLRKTFVVPKAPADYFDFSDRMLFTDFMRAWLEVVRIEGKLELSGIGRQPMKVFQTSGIDKLVEIKEAVL